MGGWAMLAKGWVRASPCSYKRTHVISIMRLKDCMMFEQVLTHSLCVANDSSPQSLARCLCYQPLHRIHASSGVG